MIDDHSEEPDAQPQPHEFAAQLTRQLYADLDGLLFDDDDDAGDDAWALAELAALSARPRGAVPLVLLRAALAAHRSMLAGALPLDEAAAVAEAGSALRNLIPLAAMQLPALAAHAARLTQYLGIAEQSSEPIHVPLARAIERFCAALGDEDAAAGSRALFELRSIVVHLDACARAIDAAPSVPEPLRIIRPDRFHDYFMHYSALAQKPADGAGEAALATLTQDGRISAVITADSHPLEVAARAVRDMISGDDTTRDHALARIHALLAFLDRLRRQPWPLVGDALGDALVHQSLVIAAATAPLHASGGFAEGTLAQVARYNQTLLRGSGKTATARR